MPGGKTADIVFNGFSNFMKTALIPNKVCGSLILILMLMDHYLTGSAG